MTNSSSVNIRNVLVARAERESGIWSALILEVGENNSTRRSQMRYIVMHKSIHSCGAGTSCWTHQTVGEKKTVWGVGEGSQTNQELVKYQYIGFHETTKLFCSGWICCCKYFHSAGGRKSLSIAYPKQMKKENKISALNAKLKMEW